MQFCFSFFELFVKWAPKHILTGRVSSPCPHAKTNHRSRVTATYLANSTVMGRYFKPHLDNFNTMIQRNAYVHYYERNFF